jgi:hypothetical protein
MDDDDGKVPGAPKGPGGQSGPATPRPTWVVVLTSLMLLFAAQLFFSGLSSLRVLREPPTATSVLTPTERVAQAMSPEDALVRELSEVTVDRGHPGATTAHAAAQLMMALLVLFVVAAIFLGDPRGRSAALLVGWLGIVYNLGNAVFLMTVVRAGVLALAPTWVALAIKQAGNVEGLTAEDMLGLANTATLVVPLATAAAGIGFCVVLLAFFGGRRGRTLYGLPSDPGRLPDPDNVG